MAKSRYFRVPLEEIAYVRAVVEGYDGLAVLWMPEPGRGELEWMTAQGMEADADQLIGRLVAEGILIEIPRPAVWPEPGAPLFRVY